MADKDDSNKSPWEEVLEEETDNKPKVFGSLDDSAKPQASPPAQLKVPDQLPDGVGSKITAEQAVKNGSAAAKSPEPAATSTSTVQTPPTAQGETKTGISGLIQDNSNRVQGSPNSTLPATPQKSTGQTPLPAPTKPRTGVSALIQKITHPSQKQVPPSLSIKQPSVAAAAVAPSVESIPVVSAPKGPVKPGPTSAPVPDSSQKIAAPPLQPETINPVRPNTAPPPPPLVKPAPNVPPGPKSSPVAPIRNILTQPKIIIVEIILVLLVGLTYFNETGFLSTGLEKVYGVVHLEALWGGLPADPQLAMIQSIQKMKYQQSFAVDSEIKFSVNKNSDSSVTKPLLSLRQPIYLFALDKAMLAVVDTGNQQSSTTTDSTSLTTDTSSISGGASTDQSSQSTANTSTSVTDTNGQDSQTSTSATTPDTGLIKDFSSKANAYFSKDGAFAKIEINNESGKQSNLDLVEQNSKLYVKSTNVDFSGSEKKWTTNNLPVNSGEILPLIFNSANLTGFSITGKRLGSGRVNNVPVYRYQVNIKIGSLLENIGIKDDMINSIEGEIDIGKKDQLIYYLELVVTPGVSSSVTRVDLKAALKDFGSVQAIPVPEGSGELAVTTPAPTPAPTITGPSAGLLARDSQRKTDLRAIETALRSYFEAKGKYPNTSGKVIQTRTEGNILLKTLVPTYLSLLPVDPWTDKYYYGYKSDGSSYELTAVLGNNSDVEGTMTGGLNLFIIRH